MATCPDCGQRDQITVYQTGDTVIVARPIGSHALAGTQVKVSAQELPEWRMECFCGWSVTGWIEDDHLVTRRPERPSG